MLVIALGFNKLRVVRVSKGLQRPNHCTSGAINSERVVAALQMSEDSETDGGPENKYLYAGLVVVFGVLWDFFVTHGGHPYLAHPQ